MRWRQVTVGLLIAALVGLPGCLGDEEVDPPPATGADGGNAPTPTTTSTAAPSPGPATPGTDPEPEPKATLTATITRGHAPLKVVFSLNASDPKGRNLTWTFDADGDGEREAHGGERLPRNVTHIYDVGAWKAVFKVTAGNATVLLNKTIEATQRPSMEPPPPVQIDGKVTGAWIQGIGYVPGDKNHTFELDRPVDRITIRLSFGGSAVDLDYEVYAPSGQRLAREAHFNEPSDLAPQPFSGPHEPETVIEGDAANLTGTWSVRVMPALAVDGDYRVTITFL